VRTFGWYEPPEEETILAAEALLEMLGALSSFSGRTEGAHGGNPKPETGGGYSITALGRKLAGIPAHPRLARLLVAAAEQGLLHEGASLAALMAEKDIVLPGHGQAVASSSDLIYRLGLLDEAERSRFSPSSFDRGVDPGAARQTCRTRDELLRIAKQLTEPGRAGPDRGGAPRLSLEENLLRLPLNAYPDRVCKRRDSDHNAAAMVGGGGARLAHESTVKQGEYFLAIDARHDPRSATRESLVRIASVIQADWLAELFPPSVRKETGVEFDPQKQRVFGFVRTWYRDLLLQDDRNAAVDPGKAGDALAAALRPKAREIFLADESSANLLTRVAMLRQHMPEHPWPEFSDDELGDALAEHCAGKRSVEELKREPLSNALRNRLVYPLDRLLEEHAPESIAVPTGNAIRLEYSAHQPPVLAVRLQELFGWTETPRVAAGRVRVRLHLLGPNYRPVQVTDDLRNFWATTYFQVRKDLRARYPKHSWPEEPLAAKPEARGRRRQ